MVISWNAKLKLDSERNLRLKQVDELSTAALFNLWAIVEP